MHQLFVDHLAPLGSVLALGGEERHYLGRALRARSGERVRLAAADGSAAVAVVQAFQGEDVLLLIESLDADADEPYHLRLDLCPPKGDAFDSALEMAVQLGVESIALVRSERTLANAEGSAMSPERLQKRLREAARQCLRAKVPVLLPWRSLEQAVKESGGVRLLMSERGGLPLAQVAPPPGSAVRLLVGPEGGFSADEVELCRAQGWQAVSLGPVILKVNTAVAAALGGLKALSPLKGA